MLGKGLESLIPKKDESNQNPPQGFSSPQNVSENQPAVPRSPAPVVSAPAPEETIVRDNNPAEATPSGGATKRSHESIFQIEIEKIKSNPYQPRRVFNEDGLNELASSIREFGIIQPLVVTKVEKETPTGTEVSYQLVAGERRLMAAKRVGLRTVPAIVKRFDVHRTKLEVALVENVQRSNLNPIETARAFARLQDEFGLTHREIAGKMGKSRETVANAVRLLGLPTNIQDALSEGKINESHARALLAAPDPARQSELFEKFLGGKPALHVKNTPSPADPETKYWERRLEEKLGHPVEIQKNKGKGKMTVRFHSESDLQNILEKIVGPEAE